MTVAKANRQPNTENGASGSESGAKSGTSAHDKALFSIIERRLKSSSKKEAFVPPELLAQALRQNSKVPVPTPILEYLCDLLEGRVRTPGGRPPDFENPRLQIKKVLIPATYERYYSWLKARKKSIGLTGWKPIQDADWWRGPPSERAARMTCRRFHLPMSWRRVQNIVSEAKK